MSRKKLFGFYTKSDEYVLTTEDKKIFQIIKEGKPFYVADIFTPWYPVKVTKYSGYGTIMLARRYDDEGNTIDEFVLKHNKWVLWADTEASAKRGVCHDCPDDWDTKWINRHGLTTIKRIDPNKTYTVHSAHCGKGDEGYSIKTDGKVEKRLISQAPWVAEYKGTTCYDSIFELKVTGATFVVLETFSDKKDSHFYANTLYTQVRPMTDLLLVG